MIPDFVDGLNLEHKAHWCTLEQVRERFGAGDRSRLCDALEHLIETARGCGFLYALVGGSFATAKPSPQDLDITWFGPPGMDRANVSCECADIMDQQTSRAKFGHDLGYIPLNKEPDSWVVQLEHWGKEYGFDVKTMKDRGTLLLELV
ncbi:hypothetical protein BH10ACI4_BH10ACI4_33860 [soil metagenome]